MMTDRWHTWANATLAAADSPALSAVQAGGIDEVPFGTRITLTGGAQLYVQWVRTSAPAGDRGPDGTERIVTADQPPAPVPVPDLPATGPVPIVDATRHIAALLHNGGNRELERVDAYADAGAGSDRQPHGVRVLCQSGAQIFGLLRYTLPPGRTPTPAAAFRQLETV